MQHDAADKPKDQWGGNQHVTDPPGVTALALLPTTTTSVRNNNNDKKKNEVQMPSQKSRST
eukprot:m.206204 g.206204  ORF g.206204 m.206204 type:complete len:61 (-) comp18496_c1_seq12:902-1084(-)